MRLTNLTVGHLAVMLTCLVCVTVLGVFGDLSETSLVALMGPIIGAVFGAAISQAATNGTTRTTIDAALERGAMIEQSARDRATATERLRRG